MGRLAFVSAVPCTRLRCQRRRAWIREAARRRPETVRWAATGKDNRQHGDARRSEGGRQRDGPAFRQAPDHARAAARRFHCYCLIAWTGDGAGVHRGAARALGRGGAVARIPGRARRQGRVAEDHLRGDGAGHQRHRPVAARPRAGAGSAAADPGRQRHRPWADGVGRHACRRAGGAGVDAVRADEPGLRQAALHLRPDQAGHDLRRRGGSLCQGAGGDRRDERRGRREPRQPRRKACHTVLDPDGRAVRRRPSMRRSPASDRIRWRRSCSPRVPPACPRA